MMWLWLMKNVWPALPNIPNHCLTKLAKHAKQALQTEPHQPNLHLNLSNRTSQNKPSQRKPMKSNILNQTRQSWTMDCWSSQITQESKRTETLNLLWLCQSFPNCQITLSYMYSAVMATHLTPQWKNETMVTVGNPSHSGCANAAGLSLTTTIMKAPEENYDDCLQRWQQLVR